MRVLHLSSLYPPYVVGGAERVVEMLAEGAAERGVVTAVTHLVPAPTDSSYRNGVSIYPLAHRNPLWIETSATYPGVVRNFNKLATLFNFRVQRDFAAVLERFSPDIVHSHSMVDLTPSVWVAAKTAGVKVVHTLHDYDLLCIRAAMFKDGRNCNPRHSACSAFSRVKSTYHRHIDHVVGVSESILQIHLNGGFFRHLPVERRHVVWNPVRAAGPSQHVGGPRSRSGAFTFGFIGRLVAEKGVNLLLEACRRIPLRGWQLRIAGSAPDGGHDFSRGAGDLPVEFVGFADPMSFFADIDVLIAPSEWAEPFGLTVVEAYRAGVPVLGTRSGGIAEVIGSVDSSWLVPPSDPEALSQSMTRLLQAGRSALPRPENFAAVLRRTAIDNVLDKYLHVYEMTLGGTGANPAREARIAV